MAIGIAVLKLVAYLLWLHQTERWPAWARMLGIVGLMVLLYSIEGGFFQAF